MMISFVIPAHNEETTLPRTLGAIHNAAQAEKLDYEIVVADDTSTDRTPEISRESGARVVGHERRQISATRNLGARAARGDLFIFVDADTRVTREAVRESVEAVRRGAVGGGAMVTFDGRVPLYARVMIVLFTIVFRWRRLSGGAFLFCTRAAYEQSGGWDETVFAGEEILFAKALKKSGEFVVVEHTVETSGRKLRTHSAREVFGIFLRFLLRGPKVLRDRSKLGLWYAPRRPDPHDLK